MTTKRRTKVQINEDARKILYSYEMVKFAPTGDENWRLMRKVLDYAKDERDRMRKQKKGPFSWRSRFHMSEWFRGEMVKTTSKRIPPPMECGTAACVAGTAVAFTMEKGQKIDAYGLYDPRPDGWDHLGDMELLGRERLGLTVEQAHRLFYMTGAKLDDIIDVASYMCGVDFR